MAADPAGFLGPDHAAGGRRPAAARQAARRRRAAARARASGRRLRARDARLPLRQDRGLDRHRHGGPHRHDARRLPRRRERGRRSRAGSATRTPRRCSTRSTSSTVQHGRRSVRAGRHPARDRGGRAARRAPGAERPLHPARVARLRERRGRGEPRPGVGRRARVRRPRRHRRRPAARRSAPRRGRPRSSAPSGSTGRRRPSSTAASRSSSSPRAPASCASRTVSRCPSAAATPSWSPGTRAPAGSRAMSSAWRAGRRRRRGRPGVTDLLLGIDVGTSACKAALVDRERRRARPRPIRPRPGGARPTGAEIDCEALFEAAVGRGARRAGRRARRAGARRRRDEHGRGGRAARRRTAGRSRPPIAWHDARGDEEAPPARPSDLGAERFAESTGLPATPLCSLAKLRWLAEHRPATRAAARWLNVAEWVVRRLGGRGRGRALARLANRLARPVRPRPVRRCARLGRAARRPPARAGDRRHARGHRQRPGAAGVPRRGAHGRRPRPPGRRDRRGRGGTGRRARFLWHRRGAGAGRRPAAERRAGAPERGRRRHRRLAPGRGSAGSPRQPLVGPRASGGPGRARDRRGRPREAVVAGARGGPEPARARAALAGPPRRRSCRPV